MVRGRKSGAVLLRPDIVKEEGPIFVASLRNQPIGEVLRFVSGLPDPEQFSDKLQLCSDIYLRWAIADVVRRRWCPTMRVESMGERLTATERNHIKAEGQVLSALLDIVSEVSVFDDGGYAHHTYWWLDCCREPSTHRMSSWRIDSSAETKAHVLSTYEGHSRMLRGSGRANNQKENPFLFGPSSRLFGKAIPMALGGTGKKADADHFYFKKYDPYLKARAELAKTIRKGGLGIATEKYFESK